MIRMDRCKARPSRTFGSMAAIAAALVACSPSRNVSADDVPFREQGFVLFDFETEASLDVWEFDFVFNKHCSLPANFYFVIEFAGLIDEYGDYRIHRIVEMTMERRQEPEPPLPQKGNDTL